MGEFGFEVPDWVVPERPPHEVFEGQHARLEPFSVQDHAAGLWDAFAEDTEGQVWDYLPDGPFVSLSQFHKFARGQEPSVDPLFFAIRDVETGKLGGFLSFLRIMPEAGSIEVGYITFAPRIQNTNWDQGGRRSVTVFPMKGCFVRPRSSRGAIAIRLGLR